MLYLYGVTLKDALDWLYQEEVSEKQDGHQDSDHEIIQQGERPPGHIVETCPLFLMHTQTDDPSVTDITEKHDDIIRGRHLISQLGIGLIVQQVFDHIQVTTAAGSN